MLQYKPYFIDVKAFEGFLHNQMRNIDIENILGNLYEMLQTCKKMEYGYSFLQGGIQMVIGSICKVFKVILTN